MKQNLITVGSDLPVVLRFGLRGEFAADGLNTFDYLSVDIGDETYNTIDHADALFVSDLDDHLLYLKIGDVTQLSSGAYPLTVTGYSARYPKGYPLTSVHRRLLEPVVVQH
jgi:hypothetical protein